MMELTAENVDKTIKLCLLTPEEAQGLDPDNLPDWIIPARGVMLNVGLHRGRIGEQTENIKSMLFQLPDSFKVSGGGGMSFLQMAVRKDDVHWGEHRSMDALLCLGLAAGLVRFCLEDRESWKAFPGGMPYLMVIDTEADEAEREMDDQVRIQLWEQLQDLKKLTAFQSFAAGIDGLAALVQNPGCLPRTQAEKLQHFAKVKELHGDLARATKETSSKLLDISQQIIG